MDLTCEQDDLVKLADDYKDIASYRKQTRRQNYVEFDYAVSHEMTLFMIEPDFSFEELEKRTDAIISAMPAIKRIFAQPFIHLKERDMILPVESVRIVNNNTLNHIASHSELWTDIKNGEIKPEKLSTRTYEDNYGIYENMVFCNVVDDILAFARANIRVLRELLYTNRTIEINLLERVNHLNYFLALGKLHIGYSRNFDSYYAVSERCLNKLQYITNSIIPRLKRPVYKNNKNRPQNLKIRKTNILSMHKEYHQVYKLAKSFTRHGTSPFRELSQKEVSELKKDYLFFCQALCIFSIGHFNFTCDVEKTFGLSWLNLDFAFKDWSLKLERKQAGDVQLLSVRIDKDKPYIIVLIPSIDKDNKNLLAAVKAKIKADEYIVCSPYEEHEKGEVLIDITSIESFRRLQQIILRGMIYADEKHTDCPFCNNKLVENQSAGEHVYECASCRTEIHEARCDETNKPYYYTKIANLRPQIYDDEESWLKRREAERAMYFRNITDIDEDNEPICPHCGNVHVH